jgi:hypothetical protein
MPRATRQYPAERRQQETVRRRELRPPRLASQDRQLVAQRKNLQLLRAVAAYEQNDQLEQPAGEHKHKRHDQRESPKDGIPTLSRPPPITSSGHAIKPPAEFVHPTCSSNTISSNARNYLFPRPVAEARRPSRLFPASSASECTRTITPGAVRFQIRPTTSPSRRSRSATPPDCPSLRLTRGSSPPRGSHRRGSSSRRADNGLERERIRLGCWSLKRSAKRPDNR